MPEIGLLPFARVALEVARAVLPPYRTRFSKHQFTQPQLLVILCLMRYEDWTFREAEVRLREHRELRAALRLSSVPDYTTVYRFLRRLPDDTIENVLGESVRRLRRSSRRGRRQAAVAVDGTGLSPHGVSTYFLRRIEQHTRGKTHYRHFLKWLVVADVDRQIILAQRARQGPWCDTPALRGLVDAASRVTPIGLVLADAEFDSEANHRHIRTTLGAQSVIPTNPRRGIPEGAIRYQMHRAFPQKLYAPRAKIETVFSVVKRKLSSKAPGRTLPMQVRQAMLLGLTFNLYRLRHRCSPPRMSTKLIDFNDDGKLDLVVAALSAPAEIWMNDSPGDNHWLELSLQGTKSNRDGIGAKIRIMAGGQAQYTHYTTASGYASSSAGPVHFGLAAAKVVDEIEIRWPSGTLQTLKNVQADRIVKVVEPK